VEAHLALLVAEEALLREALVPLGEEAEALALQQWVAQPEVPQT
jgi:hypothetical protein